MPFSFLYTFFLVSERVKFSKTNQKSKILWLLIRIKMVLSSTAVSRLCLFHYPTCLQFKSFAVNMLDVVPKEGKRGDIVLQPLPYKEIKTNKAIGCAGTNCQVRRD